MKASGPYPHARREFRRNDERGSEAGDPRRHITRVNAREGVAARVGATPGQRARAWLLARGPKVVPIPGTTRRERLEENVGADAVVLTADQLARLDGLTPAVGGHHSEQQMTLIER